jgi:hypothetical protein
MGTEVVTELDGRFMPAFVDPRSLPTVIDSLFSLDIF